MANVEIGRNGNMGGGSSDNALAQHQQSLRELQRQLLSQPQQQLQLDGQQQPQQQHQHYQQQQQQQQQAEQQYHQQQQQQQQEQQEQQPQQQIQLQLHQQHQQILQLEQQQQHQLLYGQRPFENGRVCPFCKYLYASVCGLFEHIATGCGADYRLRSQVPNDIRHTALNRLQCDICGQYFRSLWFLGKHRLWMHRSLSPDIVQQILMRLRDQPAIRDRWCNFLLSPPSNYTPSPEDTVIRLEPIADWTPAL